MNVSTLREASKRRLSQQDPLCSSFQEKKLFKKEK